MAKPSEVTHLRWQTLPEIDRPARWLMKHPSGAYAIVFGSIGGWWAEVYNKTGQFVDKFESQQVYRVKYQARWRLDEIAND